MKEKAKILQIITLADCGGAQFHLLELLKGLRHKYEFKVLVGEAGFLTEQLQDLQIPFVVLPNLVREISPGQDLKALQDLMKQIKAFDPKLVHCHSSKAGILGRLAAFLLGYKNVFTAHGWAFHPKVAFKQRLIAQLTEILCSFISNKVICVSEFDRQLAINTGLIPSSKLAVIPNGLSDSPTEKKTANYLPKHFEDKLKILMVSRFAEPKRPDLLLKAFASLPIETKAAAALVFAGDGPDLKPCQNLAQELGLENRVCFFGQVSPVEPLLAKAQVLVLLSDREGLPLSLIEGLRAGLPLLASAVGGIPELILQNENGFLVQNKPEEIAESLKRLIEDPELRNRISLANRERFKHFFRSEIMLKRIEAEYEKLL